MCVWAQGGGERAYREVAHRRGSPEEGAPRAGRRCSTETTRSGSVKASVSSVALQMDSRCGKEAPGSRNREEVAPLARIAGGSEVWAEWQWRAVVLLSQT